MGAFALALDRAEYPLSGQANPPNKNSHGPEAEFKPALRAPALNIFGHEDDGETIVALGADGLDRRGTNARLGGKHLIEVADSQNIGIMACGIDHPAVAHHIINNDHDCPAAIVCART